MLVNRSSDGVELDSFGAWVTLLSASMFFFFVFGQMNVMNTIQGELVRDLHLTEHDISNLYSAFFYGNVLFVVPAGLILDRVEIKKLLISVFVLALLATGLFASVKSVQLMALARFVLGLVGAFGFISLVKLSARCFTSRRMGLAVAVFSSWCTVGGMIAQAPAAWLMQRIGWRSTLQCMVLVGLLFAFMQCFAIRLPANGTDRVDGSMDSDGTHHIDEAEYQWWNSIRLVANNAQNWLCGLYSSATNLAVFLLGGVFGVPFLRIAHGYDLLDASMIVSTLFLGMIIGNIVFGKLPEYFGLRKPPMVIGAIAHVIVSLIILLAHGISVWQMTLLFALCGVVSGCQVLSYPVIAESNAASLTATASSLSAMLLVAGGTVAHVYSALLMWHGNSEWVASDFARANLLLLSASLLALLCAIRVKETYCRSIVDSR